MRACVRACVRAWVRACVHACAHLYQLDIFCIFIIEKMLTILNIFLLNKWFIHIYMPKLTYYIGYTFCISIVKIYIWYFYRTYFIREINWVKIILLKNNNYQWYLFQVCRYVNYLLQHPIKIYYTKDQFLLYKKSNIHIWYSNANINVVNFHRVVFEKNIRKSDISYWLYNQYINLVQKMYRFTTDSTINVGNISWLFFVKLCFPCGNLA